MALRAGLILREALPISLAFVSIGLQTAVLAAAILWCRAAPTAARVPRIAFAACTLLVGLAAGFFFSLGGSVEVFVFAVLMICMGSSWAFAWGWQPAAAFLAVSAAITVPVVLTAPSLRRFCRSDRGPDRDASSVG